MRFIALDTETGGFYPSIHALLSIGACCSWSGDTFLAYITVASQPGKTVEAQAVEKNGYSETEWKRRGARPLADVMGDFTAWIWKRKQEQLRAKFVCHNLEFDRSHLRDSERITGIEIPHRHDWRCSQIKFGDLMDKGVIEVGSSGLDRLGELSELWAPGQRPAIHEALADAQACLHGYQWLLKEERKTEDNLRQLYTESLSKRRELEAIIVETTDFINGTTSWDDLGRATRRLNETATSIKLLNPIEGKEGQ